MKKLLLALILIPGLAFGDVNNSIKGRLGVMDSNSSIVALDNGGVFTGRWVDVTGFPAVSVAVKTDQNGVLTVQYSPDCSNADSTLTRYYRTNQIEPPHVFLNARRCLRVTFTNNSGSNQTYFRMQSSLLDTSGQLNAPIDSTLSQDFDAISVRPTDYHYEVALGRRQGASLWNKFGYNLDIDTATDPEIIAAWGGTFQYLTSGETIDIVSSDAGDDGDPAGTGARQVIIWGIDENWDEQIEVVTLDGTTTVTTTSQWIGINRVSIYLAGSGLKNAGTVTVTASSSGYTMAQMPASQGTTQQCLFYVPQNHQWLSGWLLFDVFKFSGGSAPDVEIKGIVYSDVANSEFEVYRGSIDGSVNPVLEITPSYPFVIGEKSIIWFTAETSTNDTEAKCRISGELVRDIDG